MSNLAARHAAYYARKKVLVTGGAGFIGSHIVDRLVSYGAEVTVLDNLSTGAIDNLANSAAEIRFVLGSIENEKKCAQALVGVSHLFHLAGMASVATSCAQPERCQKINVDATATLYQAAHQAGVQHIVFASSAAVYGPRDTPCQESDELNPSSPYAASKLAAENIGVALAAQTPISVANLRYFNVHGPRQSSTAGAIAAFTHQITKQHPITLYGDGTQTRDFISVEEVVTASLQAGLCAPLKGQAINVASGSSTTLLAMIESLAASLQQPVPPYNHEPTRDGDIAHSAADVTRLERLLRYAPTQN